MIPMTVLFTKQSKSRAKGIRNAVIYGISIIVFMRSWIYDLDFGADALNALSTNVWFNIIFSVSGFLQLHFWEHLRLCYQSLKWTVSG
jgi:thiol:disulfide interchange protein DsbD